MEAVRHEGSFRDPSGFVFRRDGRLYRQVNERYAADYQLLLRSGLYDELTEEGLLVPHREASLELAVTDEAFRVLEPEELPFVSHPYEWSFGQLKAAALLTLEIQSRALEHGLVLKDASAFNVQFRGGRPVFIDTLSFEAYQHGAPWIAYRQFCRHFVAPLLLMSKVDVRLGRLSASHLDGVPLDLASGLLPHRTWLTLGALVHVHLHARSIRRYRDRPAEGVEKGKAAVSRRGLEGLVDNLRSVVGKASWNPDRTVWAGYEEEHSYSEAAFTAKQAVVSEFIEAVQPRSVWDLGANTGTFSAVAATTASSVVSIDSDPGAVEKHFGRVQAAGSETVLPLWVDLTNPTPGRGWQGRERSSLVERGPADLLLALALLHHLRVTGNLSFSLIARGLAAMGRVLVVEWVPKEDPQVQRLLRSREDIFDSYDRDAFEKAFAQVWSIKRRESLPDSGRVLYLMRSRARLRPPRPEPIA
jgi:ribosomal protein L11 methylase PrmA